MNLKIGMKINIALGIVLLCLTAAFGIRAAGEVDQTFNPALVTVKYGTTSNVNAVNRIATQPDGKVLVAGLFQTIGKSARSGIARLNTDGTIDPTFNPPVIYSNYSSLPKYGGAIFAIALQTDGKILIGGDFVTVGGQTRKSVARLNTDGSIDSSFGTPLNDNNSNYLVNDIKVSADNRITISGRFSSPSARQDIIRVFADGSLDASFTSPPEFTEQSGAIYRTELLATGKTLVLYNSKLYRLNANGSIDTSFTTVTANSFIYALRLQADGKILIGGGFTTLNGFTVNHLARLNADGSLDTSFSLTGGGANSTIRDIELLPDGRILIAGDFSTYNSVARSNLALLDTGGNLDNSLSYTGSSLYVTDVEILPNGQILIGRAPYSGILLPALTKVNANGSTDATFNLLIGNTAVGYRVFVQPNGKILVGGSFTHSNNQIGNNLARFNADGTRDTTFTSPISDADLVYNLDMRDDRILVSTSSSLYVLNGNGSVIGVAGGPTSDAKYLPDGSIIGVTGGTRLRKFYGNGTTDPSAADAVADAVIRRILIQSDGKYIIVGDFTTINGTARPRIARINANGTLDTTFNLPGSTNNSIFDAILQTDGKIIIGGNFTGISFNTNYQNLARLNTDGTLDTSYQPIISGGVQSLKFQPDGKLLIGGAFYQISGQPRYGIARLNADGSLDTVFNTGAGADNSVYSIDVQANGNVIIGGLFTHVGGLDRLGIARLFSPIPGRTRFDFDGDGKADLSVFRPSNGFWYELRSQDGSFAAPQFGQSGDQIAPADFDGDGKTDLAVFRDVVSGAGNLAYFYTVDSTTGTFHASQFGSTDDVPVTGDWDGDGKADLAVYRNGASAGAQSYIYFRPSTVITENYRTIPWGASGDKPLVGDFDGDGKLDPAIYRPSTQQWYILRSSDLQVIATVFGAAGDVPVPADYDGDGLANIAVFRPSTGYWYTSTNPATNYGAVQFGVNGDLPVPADYDGDGKADVAVFRPSNGSWYLLRSTQGFTGIGFGTAGDKPIPNAYIR